MVSFSIYASASALAMAAAVFYALESRKQFWNASIFLTTAKLNVLILGNAAFALLLALFRLFGFVFLGEIGRDEWEELFSQGKYAVPETALALASFREELNPALLAQFTVLMLVKALHWTGTARVESLGVGRVQHGRLPVARLLAFLISTWLIDTAACLAIASSFAANAKPSALILFGFEFLILWVSAGALLLKFWVLWLSLHLERQGTGPWRAKSSLLFYLELAADLVRLGLYLLFFASVTALYGLPLHLVRELWLTFVNLRERITRFAAYRTLTRNMNQRFPDATQEELSGDRPCIICLEDMMSAKKLPCGHMYHFDCIREWLAHSSLCPFCHADIAQEPTRTPVVGSPNANAAVDQVAQAHPQVTELPAVSVVPPNDPAAAGDQSSSLSVQPVSSASMSAMLTAAQQQSWMLQQHLEFLQQQLAHVQIAYERSLAFQEFLQSSRVDPAEVNLVSIKHEPVPEQKQNTEVSSGSVPQDTPNRTLSGSLSSPVAAAYARVQSLKRDASTTDPIQAHRSQDEGENV